jgi:hypothetical protein
MHIGYPVSLKEALRIFGFIYENSEYNNEDDEENNYKKVNKFLRENKCELRIYSSQKDQYLIGYKLNCFNAVNNFLNCDSCIEIIKKKKNQFMREIKLVEANIEYVEFKSIVYGTKYIVNYPEPIIITTEYYS